MTVADVRTARSLRCRAEEECGSPCGGRGPYAAGCEGNSRGDKFRGHERGVEQDLITGGTGATPLVAGILPADRQERSSRPPQGEPHSSPAGDNYVSLRLRASVFLIELPDER